MNTPLLGALAALPLMFSSPVLHDDAERDFKPAYVQQATGRLEAARARHAWPVNVLSIGHSTASYQNYTREIPTSPYFHGGLDIRADAGSPVYASAGGKVVNIENYVPGNGAYWEVAILDDEGFLWQYHHIERSSIPQAVFAAKQSGEPIADGTKIGEVFYWGVSTFGERYHHIHLNVLGDGGEILSAFNFLEPLADDEAPQIKDVGILKNGTTSSNVTVRPPYSLYAEVSDLVHHEKFIVPPHALRLEIDGHPQQDVWIFDRLPGGKSETKYVHDFFVPRKTCGNYECRRIFINLGFRIDGKAVFPTTSGGHDVKVTAADFAGNQVSRDFHWTVQ